MYVGIVMNNEIILPPPIKRGKLSLEETLFLRRSVREYSKKPLSIEQLSQILWATQGYVNNRRTIPSAGAIYPLETYVVIGNVEGVERGIYYYNPSNHSIGCVKSGDFRLELARACLNQMFIAIAPITVVIAADFNRTMRHYGDRGERYVLMEAGHAGQNIYLQATSMGLGTVAIGAFIDHMVSKVIGLPRNLSPLYIFPVGYSSGVS